MYKSQLQGSDSLCLQASESFNLYPVLQQRDAHDTREKRPLGLLYLNGFLKQAARLMKLINLKVQLTVSPQVTIVEKADSSSVLPSPLSISTKNRMTFLFANLKDRDFLVQRISDFLQQTTSKIYLEKNMSGSYISSDDEVCIGEHEQLIKRKF